MRFCHRIGPVTNAALRIRQSLGKAFTRVRGTEDHLCVCWAFPVQKSLSPSPLCGAAFPGRRQAGKPDLQGQRVFGTPSLDWRGKGEGDNSLSYKVERHVILTPMKPVGIFSPNDGIRTPKECSRQPKRTVSGRHKQRTAPATRRATRSQDSVIRRRSN